MKEGNLSKICLSIKASLVLALIGVFGCQSFGKLPKGEVCLVSDTLPGCICASPERPDGYDKPLEECRNYIAISPEYWQRIDEYVVNHCK